MKHKCGNLERQNIVDVTTRLYPTPFNQNFLHLLVVTCQI